jgi:hypothetical protein
MDTSTLLCITIAILAVAIVYLAARVAGDKSDRADRASQRLIELTKERPFFIIEKDDRGIVSINQLSGKQVAKAEVPAKSYSTEPYAGVEPLGESTPAAEGELETLERPLI